MSAAGYAEDVAAWLASMAAIERTQVIAAQYLTVRTCDAPGMVDWQMLVSTSMRQSINAVA